MRQQAVCSRCRLQAMKGIQALVTGAGFLLLLLALPFIWLYEQVGGPLFVVIVFGVPTTILGFRLWRKNQAVASAELKIKQTKEAREAATAAANQRNNESAGRARLQKRLDKEAQRNQPKANISRVHHFEEPDGELTIDWRRQFEEIIDAWNKGDYDFARMWLQKLAYRLKAEEAPEAVHTKFKALMADFARDDPLYAEIMHSAIPAIAENPGVIQSQLVKQFPQFDAEQFRYAMYYAEVIGDVVRMKKGRSYALSIPT